MIKKLLLSLIIVPFLGISVALCQCSPDPQYTSPGVNPDSATGLPHAIAGVNYSTTMTVNVPEDTTISGLTLQFDTIGVTSISGLPTGFTAVTNTASGYWHHSTSGCVLISGNSGIDTVGTYHLVIHVMATTMQGIAQGFTVNYYKIKIDPPAGIEENDGKSFEVFQNLPNPFSNVTEISFSSDVNSIYNVEIFNMIGKVVYKETVKAQRGVNKFNFNASDLPEGVYFYKISNGNHTTTKRMIVTSK